MERKTPFYNCHVKYGGKIVPFAGYLLPIQYSGVIAEHMAVRTKAGLFDVSHMGEIFYTGKDALANLQKLLTNDFSKMADGKISYTLMCYDNGGIVDDLLVYKFNDEKYMLVINAANKEKDVKWMKEHLFGDVNFENNSENVAQLALQGPNSKKILTELVSEKELPEKYYTFKSDVNLNGINCIISETGYTGELGYEIYLDNKDAEKLWDMFFEVGEKYGLIPCGLGARDTLRLEAGMPLYGHEMDENINPYETGLKFAVKMQKEDFIGKNALEKNSESKLKRVGMKVKGRGIAREGSKIYDGENIIGEITSGTYAPDLECSIAMALINKDKAELGKEYEAQVRNRRLDVEVINLPFYKKEKK